MNRRRRQIITSLAISAAALGTAASVWVVALNTDYGTPGDSSTPSSSPVPDDPQIFAPEEEPVDDTAPMELGLEETAEWEDGVTIRLTGFSTGTSGAEDSPADTRYVKYTVKVHNGGTDTLDLSGMGPECGLGAEGVFMDGVDGWLDSHVRPGKDITWTAACSRVGEETQIEIAPLGVGDGGTLYNTAIFTGDVNSRS